MRTIPFRRPPEHGDGATVAQVVNCYLAYVRHKLAPGTYYLRHRYLQLFAEERDRRIADCRKSDLELWIHEHKEWASDWTRKGVVSIVQAAFNWAADEEKLIPSNPFRGLTWHEGEPGRSMTDDERVCLWRATDANFRHVLLFLDETGARPGEMSSLCWPMIDFERGLATLAKHKSGRTRRQPTPRIIRLTKLVLALLRWLHARRVDDGVVFRNRRGNPWNRCSLSLRMQRLRKRAGITKDAKLYGLRHKFGTDAAERGFNSTTIAELLGHADPRTTERYYIHLREREDYLRQAAERVKRRG